MNVFQEEKRKSPSMCYIVLDADLDGVAFLLRIIFDMSKSNAYGSDPVNKYTLRYFPMSKYCRKLTS